VGKVTERVVEMIEPDADHVKTSICPGVSTTIVLRITFRFKDQRSVASINSL
jgi:hypothetical protein